MLSRTDRYRGDSDLSAPKKFSHLVKITLPGFNSHTITQLTPGDDYTSGVVDPTYTYMYFAPDVSSVDGYILRVKVSDTSITSIQIYTQSSTVAPQFIVSRLAYHSNNVYFK